MENQKMKKMRFEFLEGLMGVYGEKECVRKAFQAADEVRASLEEKGIKVEILEKAILNGKEYGREFLDDDEN